MLGYTRKVLPRIDKEMGRTHHGKDSCYKCNKCGEHYQKRQIAGLCKECILNITKEWDKEIEEQLKD